MKFLLAIVGDEKRFQTATEADRAAEMPKWMKYTEDLKNAGVLIAGDALTPSSEGVRVVGTGGKKKLVDGPFSETKEVLGGYYLIDCKSKQEAVEWASQCPGATNGIIEVRPLMVLPQG